MPGLKTWDAAGNLTLDISDRITKILGTAVLSGTSGSISADFSDGDGWLVALPSAENTNLTLSGTFTSSALSWSKPGTQPDVTIMYGIY